MDVEIGFSKLCGKFDKLLTGESDQHSMKNELLLGRNTPTCFMLNKSGYTLVEWTAWLGLFVLLHLTKDCSMLMTLELQNFLFISA